MPNDYLETLRRWMTPDEFDELRRLAGSPEAMRERHARVEQLIEAAEKKEAIWQFLKRAAGVFVATMAALAVAKGLMPAEWWPW